MPAANLSERARFLKERLDGIDPAAREKEIAALYASIRTYESDCDKAQGTLRTIASAWILATLGGIGLLVQAESTGLNKLDAFPAAALREALLIFATFGLISLWYLDQRIYQRLLHGAFAAGCWMEERFPAVLPPIRLYLYRWNFDLTTYLGWFYRAPILALMAGGVGNAAAFGLAGRSDGEVATLAALLVLQAAGVLLVLAREPEWASLRGELPPPSPPAAAAAAPAAGPVATP